MTSLNYCRLCVNIGLDFKSLYDEHGHANEVYELTTKYFDQSILNVDDGKHLTIICLQCWEHILDFNNFQQAVHVAQLNLDAFKQLEIAPSIAKTEENLTPQDLYHNISTIDKKKDYTCLVKNELISDEDVAPSNVDTDEQMIIVDEHSNINNPETLSAGESDNYNLNQEYSGVNGSHNNSNNLSKFTQISGQSPSNGNNIQNAFNEELNIFTPKTKPSFVCAICSEICCQYDNLREHFNKMHTSETIQTLCCNLNHTGFRDITRHMFCHYFKCILCGSKYRKLDSLLCHVIINHPDDDGKDYEKRLEQWSSSSFRCIECETFSPSFLSFSRHIDKIHSNRDHKCKICEKKFIAPSVLREHMTTHTGERIYTCPQCPEKFKKRSGVWFHRKHKHGNSTS